MDILKWQHGRMDGQWFNDKMAQNGQQTRLL